MGVINKKRIMHLSRALLFISNCNTKHFSHVNALGMHKHSGMPLFISPGVANFQSKKSFTNKVAKNTYTSQLLESLILTHDNIIKTKTYGQYTIENVIRLCVFMLVLVQVWLKKSQMCPHGQSLQQGGNTCENTQKKTHDVVSSTRS